MEGWREEWMPRRFQVSSFGSSTGFPPPRADRSRYAMTQFLALARAIYFFAILARRRIDRVNTRERERERRLVGR